MAYLGGIRDSMGMHDLSISKKKIALILVMVHIISPDGYFLSLVVGMKPSLSKK